MKNTNRVLKIIAFLLSFGLIACTTPIKLLPPDAVSQMGVQEFTDIKQEAPRESDPRENTYVQCVAKRILSHSGNNSTIEQWEVVLFQDPAVNAFALPGGKIGIYTGLLDAVENQHQLAAVIGHEVGHVILEHGNQQISQELLVKGGLAAIERLIKDKDPQEKREILAGLGLGAQIGLTLPYSRHHEIEADQVGLELMAKAGFDPRESVTFWENMNQSGAQSPEFLSTHPSDENRIKELRSRMTDALRLYEQAEKADCGQDQPTPGEWVSWTYEDGRRYEGEWQNNMRHGKGTLTWPDGARYEGEWQNDKAHGKGKISWLDGERYEGEWRSNKMHGRGIYIWLDGQHYEGEWQNNIRHGIGIIYWPNGARYEGEWRNDRANGIGIIYWPNGEHYEGEWRDDLRHGTGILTWPDGERYEGEWKNDVKHGRGFYLWADGKLYAGKWKNDLKHGKGTLTWPDGERYEGEWKNDMRNGTGTLTLADGRRYEGEWSDDLKHGKGTFTWPDGKRYQGEWRDDLRHGTGTLTWPDGRRYEGEWYMGEPVTTSPN